MVVEYDELAAVLDPLLALADDAPIIHEDYDNYLTTGRERPFRPHPNLHGMSTITKGDADIERVLASADRVIEHTFTTPRQHQGYIEPHVSLLWIEDDMVRILTSSKSPFRLRNQMSTVTGLPVEQIEVDSYYVGGDFGGKGLSMDDFALYYVARETGRPVKAVMSYSDELQASAGRHGAVIRLRTGVMNDGRIVAHDADVIFDGGVSPPASRPKTVCWVQAQKRWRRITCPARVSPSRPPTRTRSPAAICACPANARPCSPESRTSI